MHLVTLYKSKTGWRWRATRKGRIVANGGQGYSRRIDAERALMNLLTGPVTITDADGTSARRVCG